MTEQQYLEMLNGMSEAELTALENTTFPEDITKQAEAELAQGDLANALVGYGMLRADREIAETEALDNGGELAKEATAEFAQASEEVEEAIEAGMEATGLLDTEDEIELHKEAQASAGLIFAGYSAQLEKHAAKGAKEAKTVAKLLKEKMHKGMKAAKGAGHEAMKHMKSHKGAYAAGLGGMAAGYGAAAAKKKMDKKASEATVSEVADEVFSKIACENVIVDGLEKCAAAGHHMGEKVMKHLRGGAKHVAAHGKKHGGKYLSGAAGLGLGVGAHAAHKKD